MVILLFKGELKLSDFFSCLDQFKFEEILLKLFPISRKLSCDAIPLNLKVLLGDVLTALQSL